LIQRTLLDLNVLIALADQRHDLHQAARNWYSSFGKNDWGICPFTEAGFVRVTTNPTYRPGPHTIERTRAILQALKGLRGYRYWEINDSWVDLTAPFADRISGHQQITDAYLLGLAIREDGVLITFDRGIRYMAGAKYARNVLLLE
jgi:uncharacterized protein